MKQKDTFFKAGILLLSLSLLLGTAGCGAIPAGETEIDISEERLTVLEATYPADEYVFYAPSRSVPRSIEEIQAFSTIVLCTGEKISEQTTREHMMLVIAALFSPEELIPTILTGGMFISTEYDDQGQAWYVFTPQQETLGIRLGLGENSIGCVNEAVRQGSLVVTTRMNQPSSGAVRVIFK